VNKIFLILNNQELVPKFYAKYHDVISKFGRTGAWNALPLETQQAHLARMSEDFVINPGKDVYEMMSDKEKQYLTYLFGLAVVATRI